MLAAELTDGAISGQGRLRSARGERAKADIRAPLEPTWTRRLSGRAYAAGPAPGERVSGDLANNHLLWEGQRDDIENL